jgi:hypothetical protein
VKKIFIALILLNSFYVQAQDMCELRDKNTKLKINLGKTIPEFFFKYIMPQDLNDKRNQATVIVSGKGNVILDLDSGEIKKIPGPFDAVPSIDGKIITVPGNPENDNAFTLYSREDLTKPLYEDRGRGALVGVYQSVGITQSSDNKKVYRVITDSLTQAGRWGMPAEESNVQNLEYKDYEVEGQGKNMKVKPVADAGSLCSNLQALLKLPMLSKNGQKLAAYNSKTGTTNIFSIGKDDNGKSICNLDRDLGFASTKVEFNEDSSKITFAADSLATKDRQVTWYAQPMGSAMNMNVYVLDLKTNKLNRISNSQNANAYYPSFSRDGTVTYLNQEYTENGKTSYSLIQASLNNDQPMDFKNKDFYNAESCNYSTDELSVIALGKLWFKVCAKYSGIPTVFGSRALAVSLEPKSCATLVKKYWAEKKGSFENYELGSTDAVAAGVPLSKNKIWNTLAETNFDRMRNLTEEDLLNQCPQQAVKSVKKVVKEAIDKDPYIKGKILITKCSGCHSNGSGRSFVVGDEESMIKFKERAFNYVNSGYMPMGNPLTPQEKTEVMQAILEL